MPPRKERVSTSFTRWMRQKNDKFGGITPWQALLYHVGGGETLTSWIKKHTVGFGKGPWEGGDKDKAYPLTDGFFYQWLKKDEKNRWKPFREARTGVGSWALMDKAQEIVDTEKQASRANLAWNRARIRTTLATKFNKQDFGDQAKVEVNIGVTLQSLHLEALEQAAPKAVTAIDVTPPALESGEEEEED